MSVVQEVRPPVSAGPARPPATFPLRLLRTGLGIVAALAIAVFVVLAIRRVLYPYQLEWLEGGAVEHVRRILRGRQLYPAPGVDFVAYPYPPLYFLLSSAVALLTGVGYLPLRIVSLAGSLASMALLYAIVRREGGARWCGLVAAGLFAAGFRFTGGFYDVARVDALLVALLLGCLYAALRARTARGLALAGLLLALAGLTKQSAIIMGIPMAAVILLRDRRHGLAFIAAAVVPAGAASLVLQATSSGWYGRTVVGVLAGHGVDPTWWTGFWTRDLAPHLWPAAVLAALALWWLLRRRTPGRWALPLAAAGGLVAASFVSRLHSASSENVLIPVMAAVALTVGLLLSRLAEHPPRRQVVVAALCLAQFGLLAYQPAQQLPPASQTATARQLQAVLRALPGDVVVVSHPWDVTLAGKGDHAHAGAIADVVRSHDAEPRAAVEASIADAVRAQRFSVLAFDNDQDYAGFPADLERFYRRVPPPPGLGPPAAPTLATPFVGHPTQWWVARRLNKEAL
jgi:4-amino-4-deoxy-L-arabinose transferase-like glycosyltransferase